MTPRSVAEVRQLISAFRKATAIVAAAFGSDAPASDAHYSSTWLRSVGPVVTKLLGPRPHKARIGAADEDRLRTMNLLTYRSIVQPHRPVDRCRRRSVSSAEHAISRPVREPIHVHPLRTPQHVPSGSSDCCESNMRCRVMRRCAHTDLGRRTTGTPTDPNAKNRSILKTREAWIHAV